MSKPLLEILGVSKSYGDGPSRTQAIDDLTFSVERGEFTCVVGPSGCGKTTLLKCLSGLMRPTAGMVVVDGEVVTQPVESLALVFQDYGSSLMPWRTVLGNVILPLRSKRGIGREERQRLADDAIAAVGLSGFGDHYPWQLSGGMQQRVAIARALAYQPEILLMDEPFASVDAQTRAELEDLMLRLHRELGVTVVLVTHDIDESVYLGDRVVVLTGRPSRVKELVPIDLPRPRDQVETKELVEFARLRGHVMRQIKQELGQAHAPTAVSGI